MWELLKRLFARLVDALVPPHPDVVSARSFSAKKLGLLVSPWQSNDGHIHALFPYRDPSVRALVRAVKYYGEIEALATPAQMLGEYALELIADKEALEGWERPLILAMPSSRERLRERGYNQAHRIAAAALPSMGSAAELRSDILVRENRESQVHVERAKRKDNICGAFSVPDAQKAKGGFFILIDDVVESGSTFYDARRALMKAGARDVIEIALAH